MTLPIFPDIPTMAWNNKMRPLRDVVIKKSGSKKRKAMTTQAYPVWEMTFSYTCLDQEAIEKVAGFLAMVGNQLSPFLWKDREFYKQENVRIGVGNGSNTGFQLLRNWGGYYVEPMRDIVPGTLTIFVDDNPVSATLEADGWVLLAAPPETGAIVTATFEYYWRVAFEETPDWDNFWYGFYKLNTFKLVTDL